MGGAGFFHRFLTFLLEKGGRREGFYFVFLPELGLSLMAGLDWIGLSAEGSDLED